MMEQGFRGNCDSKGKLGMCSSLAEPDSGGIPRRTSLRENGLQRPAKGGSTPAFACGSYYKLLFFRSFIASSKKLRANISHCSQLYSITNSFLTNFQIP